MVFLFTACQLEINKYINLGRDVQMNAKGQARLKPCH